MIRALSPLLSPLVLSFPEASLALSFVSFPSLPPFAVAASVVVVVVVVVVAVAATLAPSFGAVSLEALPLAGEAAPFWPSPFSFHCIETAMVYFPLFSFPVFVALAPAFCIALFSYLVSITYILQEI